MKTRINKKSVTLLFVIVILGFALRAAVIIHFDNKVYWEDESDYLALAQRIVNGEGYTNSDGTPTAFRPVGYPLFLAFINFLHINSLLAIRLFQAVLSVLSIVVLYFFSKEIAGWRAGIVAAFFMALYPYFIFAPATILAITWFNFLLLTATFAFYLGATYDKNIYLFTSAVLFAMSLLTRPSGLVFIGCVSLWYLTIKHVSLVQSLKRLTPFVMLVVVLTLPWAYRNYSSLHIFNLASNGGRNLWLGNNELTTRDSGSNIAMSEKMQQKIDTAAGEFEKNNIYTQEAKKFIRDNPYTFLSLCLKKSAAFWRLDPSPTTDGYVEKKNLLGWAGILSTGPVFFLALFGFVGAPVYYRKQLLLFVFYAVFFTALHAIFISKVRLRLPLDQFMMISAAIAVVCWKEIFISFKKKLYVLKKNI